MYRSVASSNGHLTWSGGLGGLGGGGALDEKFQRKRKKTGYMYVFLCKVYLPRGNYLIMNDLHSLIQSNKIMYINFTRQNYVR